MLARRRRVLARQSARGPRRNRLLQAERPARRSPGARSGSRQHARGDVSAPARPKTARLLASVPPEVKITSAGSAPRIRATRFLGELPGTPRRSAESVPALGISRRQENTDASPRAPRDPRMPSRCDPGRSARDAWPLGSDWRTEEAVSRGIERQHQPDQEHRECPGRTTDRPRVPCRRP